MKKMLFLLCLLLAGGCGLSGKDAKDNPRSGLSESPLSPEATESAAATLTPASSPSSLLAEKDQLQTEQPVNTREETFRLNDKVEWKAEYAFYGMFREDMVLSRSQDGGVSWNVVAKSGEGNGNLPNGIKTGLFFLDENKGWITSYSPRQGTVGLSETEDCGRTWDAVQLEVPQGVAEAEITAYPPLFVSSTDGMLMTTAYSDDHPLLFYVTHDGGKSWNSVDSLSGESGGLRWEFSREPDAAGYSGTVTFGQREWSFGNGSFGG